MLENVFLEERASCLHNGTLHSVHCAVCGESEGPEQRASLLQTARNGENKEIQKTVL